MLTRKLIKIKQEYWYLILYCRKSTFRRHTKPHKESFLAQSQHCQSRYCRGLVWSLQLLSNGHVLQFQTAIMHSNLIKKAITNTQTIDTFLNTEKRYYIAQNKICKCMNTPVTFFRATPPRFFSELKVKTCKMEDLDLSSSKFIPS